MITISDSLKRCPVCGDIPDIVSYPRGVLRPGPTKYSVECRKCHISGRIQYSEEEAVKAWNEKPLGIKEG